MLTREPVIVEWYISPGLRTEWLFFCRLTNIMLPQSAELSERSLDQPHLFQRLSGILWFDRHHLLCRGTASALNGCINDAHCMMFLLKSRFQFQDADFRVLTDDQGSPACWPTKANMFEGFRWLVGDARPGDSLVFHFSGECQAMVKRLVFRLEQMRSQNT